MEKIQTSEVIVRIPPSVAADIGNDEIIDLLLAKALGKKDLYYGRDFCSRTGNGIESIGTSSVVRNNFCSQIIGYCS